jgi:hypothetical protein
MATIEEVAEALQELGYSVIAHPADPPRIPLPFINVHGEDNMRTVPVATVWPPNPDKPGDGWAWGSHYQYGAHGDDDAETVAQKVSRTIDAQQRQRSEG